jgi:hypothetical protein
VTPLEKGTLGLEIFLATLVLTGLAVRGKYRSAISFDAYLFSILSFEFLLLVWPARFFNWNFWLAKEAIQSLLKVAITMELALRIFRNLPRVRVTAWMGLILILVGTWLSLTGVDEADAELQAAAIMPKVFYATAIMFGLVLTLALWYQVPLTDLQRAILVGFTPYLLSFTVGLQLVSLLGHHARIPVNYVNSIAFFYLLSYWARVAWKDPAVASRVLATVASDIRNPTALGRLES